MGWQDAPFVSDSELPDAPVQAKPRWMSAPLANDDELRSISAPAGDDVGVPAEAQSPKANRWASAVIRPIMKYPVTTALLPLDAFQGLRNVLTGTNYEHPSQALNRIVDKYTVEPEGFGKAAEFVSGTLLGGRVLRPLMPPSRPVPPLTPPFKEHARKVIEEGRKANVPVFYDDVTRSTVAKQIGIGAEYIPFGTAPGRARQAEAATRAMGRKAATAQPSIDEQVPVLLQKNLQTQLSRFKKTKDRLYTDAKVRLDRHGKLKAPRFNSELNKVISEVKSLNIPKQSKLKMLRVLVPYRQLPPGKFSDVQILSDEIGEVISSYYTGRNAVVGKRGVQYLQRIQQALKQDADEFAAFAGKTDPDAEKAWKVADHFYKARIGPFKEAGFRDLVKTAEPEKVWQWLVTQGGKHSRADRMWSMLDKNGRQAVRYGLLKDAYDVAMGPHGIASPAKFAKYMEDHRPVVETFFKGRDLQELDGFVNLMRHVERAGTYAGEHLKPTGQRLIFLLLSTGAIMNPKTAATVAGTGLATRRLFQTEGGRDFLIRMSRAKPGSRSADAISSALARYLIAGGAPQVGVQVQEPAQISEQTDLSRIVPEAAPSGSSD